MTSRIVDLIKDSPRTTTRELQNLDYSWGSESLEKYIEQYITTSFLGGLQGKKICSHSKTNSCIFSYQTLL